jgi:endonuclease/exonuclease/phosphatase family metal-dependent hydrolase
MIKKIVSGCQYGGSMRFARLALALILCLLTAIPSDAKPIKIATWHIEHLRDKNNEGPNKRKNVDYERLAMYAKQLDADIIALQEVEGPAAARRVFSPDKYDFYFSRRNNPMLTGFAVSKNFNVIQNEDYDDLNVTGGLRHGTDITVIIGDIEIRMLSVHLMAGCWRDPLSTNKDACNKLRAQLAELEKWIDARAAEGEPFIVLGDFNRRFDILGDTFWPEIDDGEPANADLSRVTKGKINECWNKIYPMFIDHIVYDRITSGWVVEEGFSQLVYTEGTELKKKLSDHCPISSIIDPELAGKQTQFTRILDKIDSIEKQLEELKKMVHKMQQ